jgi:flagellar export protein FliJ
MKSRDTILRLKRFQVDEKRRRVAQIEMMIADFERMATELDREIQLEEQRAGISDKAHFAYPTYARAAMQRKENLVRSADDLRAQLNDARGELEEAFEELKKFEILDDREHARDRATEAVRDQAELDRVALSMRSSFARA